MKFLTITILGVITVVSFMLFDRQRLITTVDLGHAPMLDQMHISEHRQNVYSLEDPSSQEFLSSPLVIGILWPVVFALLEILAGSLSGSQTRPDDKQKYKMTYKEDDLSLHLLPLDLSGLRKQFSSEKQIVDVEVLPAGFLEASFGIDLCIGALSTTFINLLIISNNSVSVIDSPIMYSALVVMVMQIIALVSIIYFLQNANTIAERRRRILSVQFTNLLGLLAIFISFYTLGKILI